MVKRTFFLVVIKGVVKIGGSGNMGKRHVGQNIFCKISLYIESAHITNERIINFKFSAFIKWPNIYTMSLCQYYESMSKP